MYELTVTVFVCTKSSQRKSSVDTEDDLQAPPLTEELLAVKSCRRREDHGLFGWLVGLGMFPLVGFQCSSGWPHTYAHVDSSNCT